MVDWKEVGVPIITTVLVILFGGTAIINYLFSAVFTPDMELQITPQPNGATVYLTNAGRAPASNVVLTVESPAYMDSYKIMSTENYTHIYSGGSDDLHIFIPRFVQGNGSFTRIDLKVHRQPAGMYGFFITHDKGSSGKLIPSSKLVSALINHPPQAEELRYERTNPGKQIQIRLSANDEDTDNLTAAIITLPRHGHLSKIDQDTGSVTYTPSNNFTGPDSFTFKAFDIYNAESNIGNISIFVAPGNALAQTGGGMDAGPGSVPVNPPTGSNTGPSAVPPPTFPYFVMSASENALFGNISLILGVLSIIAAIVGYIVSRRLKERKLKTTAGKA